MIVIDSYFIHCNAEILKNLKSLFFKVSNWEKLKFYTKLSILDSCVEHFCSNLFCNEPLISFTVSFC